MADEVRGLSRLPADVRLRLHTCADPQTGCQNWTGPLDKDGYGRLRMLGHGTAHRVAYELANGKIPHGLQIDHLCRNHRCCNPDHMEAVTQRENVRRGESPAARFAGRSACVRGHPFTAENTRIEQRRTRNYPNRACRACDRIRAKQRYDAAKSR